MNRSLSYLFTMILFTFATATSGVASPVTRQGSGANAAAIQAIVDQFRADLGGANNGVGGSFTSGRREINWDGVPDSFSEPNLLPSDFFNANSPRGAQFLAFPDLSATSQDSFSVSADSDNPTATPVRFANINGTYSAIFQTFSAQRLFIAKAARTMEVVFFIPGTNIPATVSGFGAVFCDVDNGPPTNGSLIRFIGTNGKQLTSVTVPVSNNGLSFAGVSFNAGERIAKVVIEFGNADLSASNTDGVGGVDVVAMDDFIYGEPRAAQFHSGDADGDGLTDARVFRASVGTWFTLNSGSNTVSFDQFGTNGDIPVDGDFDGDSRADVAIFRPSDGTWWFRRSSNSTIFAATFGQNGDKPVAGDYDKDGKTDIAFWRPGNGNYFVLRSVNNFTDFFAFPFGANGDIPVQGAAQ